MCSCGDDSDREEEIRVLAFIPGGNDNRDIGFASGFVEREALVAGEGNGGEGLLVSGDGGRLRRLRCEHVLASLTRQRLAQRDEDLIGGEQTRGGVGS